jgi:hypothetical protein
LCGVGFKETVHCKVKLEKKKTSKQTRGCVPNKRALLLSFAPRVGVRTLERIFGFC